MVLVRDGRKVTIDQSTKNYEKDLPEKIEWRVPFTAQAPLGDWESVEQGNGCEEASIIMAYSWASDREISLESAVDEIEAMSDFSFNLFGHFHDISNEDTLKLFKEYFEFDNAYLEYEVSVGNIKEKLAQGNIVIVAVNGDILGNLYYDIPEPANHKIVIKGYEEAGQEFITNDPGTSRGESYRYKYDRLFEAITDYPTGYLESFEEVVKSMIVVEKDS